MGRFCKIDASDSGQQVDAPRWKAELDDRAGPEQILPGHGKSFDRRAELAQRTLRTIRVRLRGFDPDIEVPGCPRNAMHRHRVRTDHDKARAGVVQGDQQIAEVIVQMTGSPLAGRMTRTGIRSRG